MKTRHSLLTHNINFNPYIAIKTQNNQNSNREIHSTSKNVTFHNPKIITPKTSTHLKSTSQRDTIPTSSNLIRKDNLKVFVVGATGQTGKIIIEKLKEQPEVSEIRAFVKDETKGQNLIKNDKSEKVKLVKGNLEDIESIDLKGCTSIINAAGAKDFLMRPLAPYLTEYEGIKNLISAAKTAGGISKIIHISSIGVNEDNLVISLAFWGLLFFKRRGEQEIQRSGIDYTIIRPSGLVNTEEDKRIIMSKKDTYGFGRDKKRTFGLSISRLQVADCCVAALNLEEASNKIVEVVADGDAEKKEFIDLFGDI